ncbi:MAG: 16S rRNA processing protein RimM [Candidatus Wallbacteria bacterium]|nr:16S rRNA processing protein RimM [Candidatus Wallbacteria bacterium]
MTAPYATLGKIVGAHGIRGEVKVLLQIDDVDFALELEEMYLSTPAGGDPEPRAVEAVRAHKAVLLVKLEGVPTRNAAEALVGRDVFIPAELEPEVPEGSFKLKTLLGLTVVDGSGAAIGQVRDVSLYGERSVLEVVMPDGFQVAIPFVGEYVTGVDLKRSTVTVTEAFRRLLAPEEVGP